jgi:two-component system, chemotaxis family, sensor kinase CheA
LAVAVDNNFSQDETLVREFLVESEELLQRMDQDMIALESAPMDAELLNRVFRSMHTIKGTSGFLGFGAVVRLSHRAEDVLNALRRGDVILNARVANALLAARDQIGKMLEDIRQGGLKEYSLEPLLAELQAAESISEAPLRLGEILVKNHVLDAATLAKTLAELANAPHGTKLGALIVEKGLATPAQVGDAVADQQRTSDSLAKSMSSQTMRVDVRKLDELVDLIGELVLERNRLVQINRDLSAGVIAGETLHSVLSESTARLSFITEELQVAGLETRMIPVETVFRRFPRLVRDVSQSLQKETDLVLLGEDTELDKTMAELIGDPLLHLVRNCLDHGLELPAHRVAAGKPRHGTIRMEARQEGDQIVISVSDDGAGIDPDRVARKAVEKGLISKDNVGSLPQKEILDFIFLPGFSTADKTSDLSGRGVGMDVVRSNLKKMNGTIDLESKLGVGTTVHLRLPLTLAILPVLLVQVAAETYALPLRTVLETASIRAGDVHAIEGREVLQLRKETLPLLRLAEMIGVNAGARAGQGRRVVVLGIGEKKIALMVDELLGQESTVVKPLGSYLQGCSTVAGATIGGDGRVRLVLDPAALISGPERQKSYCSA